MVSFVCIEEDNEDVWIFIGGDEEAVEEAEESGEEEEEEKEDQEEEDEMAKDEQEWVAGKSEEKASV